MTHVAAIILAAGQASRFRVAGGQEPTKLVALYAGEPLVRHVACAALASKANPVLLVTGHAGDAVKAAVADLPLRFVHNAAFAEGLSSSLKAGILALPPGCLGAVILLGDMPSIEAATIDRLIDRLRRNPDADAAVLLHDGRRGNPVLLCRTTFGRVHQLTGDMGARALLRDPALHVEAVHEAGDAVLLDVDEPRDLASLVAEAGDQMSKVPTAQSGVGHQSHLATPHPQHRKPLDDATH